MERKKCIVCGLRPQKSGSQYCNQCGLEITAETKKRKPEVAFRYLHYRGVVVGMFPNGGDTYRPRLVRKDVKYIPKSKLIDLDRYCSGFTREQVKAFKRAIRAVSA